MSTSNYYQKVTSNSADHIKNKNNCNFYASPLHMNNQIYSEFTKQIPNVNILERKEKFCKEIRFSRPTLQKENSKTLKSNPKKSIFYFSYLNIKTQKISKKLTHLMLNEIISQILRNRVEASLKIQKFFRLRNFIKNIKTQIMINIILSSRLKGIVKIQKTVRMYFCKKSVRCILNLKKNNWGIFYYPQIEVRSVKINLDLDFKFQEIKLNYNRILKCFYFFLKKNDYFQRFYKFYFIINNKALIDMNFENIVFPNGKIYNILDVELIKSKGYLSNFHEQELKFCPPVRTATTPDIRPNKTAQLFNRNNIKSILKKNSLDDYAIKKRKVSFNLALQYCE
jgi:hypothetical protein